MEISIANYDMDDKKKDNLDKTSILYRLKQMAGNANLRPRSLDAWNFYIKQVRLLRTPLRKSPGFSNDSELIPINRVQSGMLVYFSYSAITETLPFWDSYPTTLIINRWVGENGRSYIDGINFHYLPPNVRFRVMLKLIQQYNYYNMDNKVNKFSGVNNYYALRDLLASSGFSFAYKKYLVEQVQSNFYSVPLKYMDVALSLPTADWQKGASNSSVWSNYAKNALSGKF